MAISAGPIFKLNPSVSFMLNFDPSRDPDAKMHLDEMWSALSKGGKVLIPLDTYPFSKWYGWIQDKYGVSWQITSSRMDEMMKHSTQEQIDRVTQAFLPMKKFDVDVLEKAYEGAV